MGRCYDNWERLVNAVMLREQFRQLSMDNSRSPSIRSLDSDYSFSSSTRLDEVSFGPTPSPSPLHPDAVKLKVARNMREAKQSGGGRKVPTNIRNLWKGLSIFRAFTTKKDYGKEEREFKWAHAQRTLHGLRPHRGRSPLKDMRRVKDHSENESKDKRRAEIERLRDLHTLKGHIEALVKLKGLDMDKIQMYYTI